MAMQVNPNTSITLSEFEKELQHVINKYSRENMSDTPDFILAQYLDGCLTAYSIAVSRRDQWYGTDMWGKSEVKGEAVK